MNQNYTDIIDDLRFLTEPAPLMWLALAICVVLGVLFFVMIRRRKKKVISSLCENTSAEQVYMDALAELEKLRARLTREQSRDYAIQASAIVRTYIEQRFEIAAPLRSSEEFFEEAQKSNKFDESDRRALREFLFACDFLKFARAWAEKEELEKLHNLAVEFVKKTHNHRSKVETGSDTKPESRDASVETSNMPSVKN